MFIYIINNNFFMVIRTFESFNMDLKLVINNLSFGITEFCEKRGNEIISQGTLLDRNNGNFYLCNVSSKERGAGSILLKDIIEYSKKNNFKKITLDVLSSNELAIKLYKKFGFENFSSGLVIKKMVLFLN